MTRPPNIIFILIDDLGGRDLGCYGSTFYETPRLDALARQGMRFTDAYASAPVCSPTRASIMSGKYPANVGVTQYIGAHGVGQLLDVPFFPYLPTNEFSLARALRAGGYRTWHVGKWHLGPRKTWPDQHGFDVNVGGCDWGHPRSYVSPYGCPTLADGPDGEYLTDRLTDEAIELIRSAGDQPFFLNFWHYAVHIPIVAPADLVAKYERKAAEAGLGDTSPFEIGERFPVWHMRNARISRRTIQSDPGYAAMMENLDTNVGRLLDALDQSGRADDTLVVFTSDNGGLSTSEGSPTSNVPLAEGKGWIEDGGTRVPLIVRWPGQVRPGSVVGEPVTSPDFYPTFLAAAGLPARPEQHQDGVDITPLLRGQDFERGPLFWHYPHYSNQGGTPAASMRDGRWKLVHWFESGRDALYDIVADIGESHDLAAAEPELTQQMAAVLGRWLGSLTVGIPRPNPQAEPFDDLAGYYLAGVPHDPPED